KSIQPDYSDWESVQVGMSEVDLKKLLGKPIQEDEIPERFKGDPTYPRKLSFGRITFDSPSMPQSFDFYVFIQQGKVVEKKHPFQGELSRNGKPTTPVLIYPRDRTEFDHCPRFVDLRWQPSSGKYPIEYAIQVEIGNYELCEGDKKAVVVYHSEEDFVS